MSTIEQRSPIEPPQQTVDPPFIEGRSHPSLSWGGRAYHAFPWMRYLLDSLLALVGILLVTSCIALFALYPRIPNISIIYLFVVLLLATTRGQYAAIFAAITAFLSFDFFIVPPLYTFTMYQPDEWVALFVFLATAILTSHLAVKLRDRAAQASLRERQTRLLYNLLWQTNHETEPGHQLQAIARSVVDALSTWGVHDCAILQPDSTGSLIVSASAYQPTREVILSSDEKAVTAWVMLHKRMMGLYDEHVLTPSTSAKVTQRIIVRSTTSERAVRRSIRFIPLNIGQKVVGVLRLRVLDQSQHFPQEEFREEFLAQPSASISFFWTFLDQVSALVENAHLQRENLRIELLQRTDALRSALLSSVSHDLRTPLTSIKAAASSLLEEDVQWDDEASRGFAQAIEREADRLNRLVGNLLDMSRIEEGALHPEKEEYSLTTLIYDVLERLKPSLAGHVVHTHLPDDLLLIELDYLQIDQVLTNLLENAIRYTPKEAPIELSAHIEGEQIVLRVADRGPGIPSIDLERIFDKFYRVLHDQPPSGYPTGSGLGLAVCRGLVEAHGGRIWAELREGGGLSIIFTLPLHSTMRRSISL